MTTTETQIHLVARETVRDIAVMLATLAMNSAKIGAKEHTYRHVRTTLEFTFNEVLNVIAEYSAGAIDADEAITEIEDLDKTALGLSNAANVILGITTERGPLA
ncbi:hypothetical protein M3D15_08725 [Pseudoclavibacter alba]|uniref:Uncharacterized protein n=1 Tax=Pseudoclavibacter albus TaxID=272241 RepID=A0ABT2HYL1_9MICO|nr:hypothetical protein [Pseudoclavibacter alba]MCT2043407.1 hypothetical protein [Pseudoclavibacter alba]